MKEHLARLKEKIFSSNREDDHLSAQEDYIEIDTGSQETKRKKVMIRPFVIENFDDIKPALDSLREGYTIALVNIKPIKDKDIIELKRAVNKLKKTCDAIEGDIAGFGEDWIVVAPNFAQIYRNKQTEEVKE
ncbi:cell division protein SepF [Candidatus Woesearchaeota archaeon]|nr:cell division protein SepF [Candidatus Woesearchaeota archaeon]